ncbi:helix-turn-helix domain-containing protein [Nocardia halotolerans]|uniref:Helix-turn-helix domain-containing protein n=1 Tax=Nocardia halotolerans TaxID=1755878 RepID=A0ABV8VKX2_9NOCA
MSSRGEQGNVETTLVGARLRRLREEAGLSLAALATRVPYSRAALGHYETGTRAAPSEVIDWYERVHAHRAGKPLIEIGPPHQGANATGYHCPFRIDGLLEGEATGTDPAAALHSALRAVGAELARKRR